MSTQAQLASDILAQKDIVAKISTDVSGIVKKISDLESALANQSDVTPELQSAFDALKEQITVVTTMIPA